VKEQSHKSEMRAALQGDFERLRARRDDTAPAVAIAPAVVVPMPEPGAVEPVVTEPVAVEPQSDRPSWLDRLLGRR
jgi:hypothetical protein